MKATWNNAVIAESDDTISIEGNHYFPPASVKHEYLQPSSTPYTCWWRGKCTYYSLKVGEEIGKDACWAYLEPPQTAIDKVGQDFTGYIAFWHTVDVG